MMLTSNQRVTHLCTANFKQLNTSEAVDLLNGNECGQKVHEIQCQSSIDSTARTEVNRKNRRSVKHDGVDSYFTNVSLLLEKTTVIRKGSNVIKLGKNAVRKLTA